MTNEELQQDEIVFCITKEQVQEFMESNYARLLTDEEMALLSDAFYSTEEYPFIDEAVRNLFEKILERPAPKYQPYPW